MGEALALRMPSRNAGVAVFSLWLATTTSADPCLLRGVSADVVVFAAWGCYYSFPGFISSILSPSRV